MKTLGKVLNKGDRVSLAGLHATGMNGKKGIIHSLPNDDSSKGDDRYGVWVDGSKKPIAIKAANITIGGCEGNEEENSKAKKSPFVDTKDQAFQKGDRVTLVGLEASELNGKRGIIISPSNPSNENRYGVRIDGIRKPMGVKPTNIRPVAKTTRELKKEYKEMESRIEHTGNEILNVDQMKMMRMMMNTFVTEEHQIKMHGRKIEPLPDFRLELINEGGGFPKAINYTWANNYLCEVYEQECDLPHMFELAFKSPKYESSPKDLMKRLGTNCPLKLAWYFSAGSGDIFKERIIRQHATCLRYSYSNQAYKKEKLYKGKTHVAVGFVDLGFLLAADLMGSGASPLRFIGIDQSAYVVAKTSLIWELIQHAGLITNTNERNLYKWRIIQVWFSTTWSEGTESAVKAALCSLLSSPVKSPESEVRKILEHWYHTSSIPLKEAREKVQSFTNSNGASIGLLKKKQDRISMAKYQLTGDFGVRNPTCGSIVLLDCPDGTPPPPSNETVFSALPFEEVMEIANLDSRTTIVGAAETYVLAGITKLISWSGSNHITVDLRCAMAQDAIDEIASERPLTMSWSNVLDYFDYSEFHKMARECSKYGDTIHYGYSMNWSSIVSGTCLLDYGDESQTEYRKKIMHLSNGSLKASYISLGWESYFRFPLPQNPINTVARILEARHYLKWAEYFFSVAHQDGLALNDVNTKYGIYSPITLTGESTVHLTWTYSKN